MARGYINKTRLNEMLQSILSDNVNAIYSLDANASILPLGIHCNAEVHSKGEEAEMKKNRQIDKDKKCDEGQ